MADLVDAITAAIGSVLDTQVRILTRRPLGGGDISAVERVGTSAGTFIVKSHASAPSGFFRAEAAGLRALSNSGTSLRVPAVIAVHDGEPPLIVLEDVGRGDPAQSFDQAFGRGLAELHQHRGPRFGFDVDTFCGLTVQPNTWMDSWISFYGEMRLRHQVSLAAQRDLLTSTECARVDRLIERLDTLIDEPADGPVLIHGDLWSGNLHVATDGRPTLIDPSGYFAHREAELGMMTLFGGFDLRVYDAYADVLPLERGWRERTPVYQLYHLLNHLNLFGGAYHSQVMAITNRFV